MTNIFKATDEEIFCTTQKVSFESKCENSTVLTRSDFFFCNITDYVSNDYYNWFLFLGVTFLVYAFISTWDF